jgi:membrane-associated phospholipid phosphatase
MRYSYRNLYEKSYAFYAEKPRAVSLLKIANKLFTAAFFIAYTIVVWQTASNMVAANRYYEVLMRLLFAPLLCLLLVTMLRYAVNRPRPYSEQGAQITPLKTKKGNADKSFPSRHLASAFVIAVAALSYSAILGIVLLPFAFALGYIRFALGLHYPSDLFGGAIIGTLCGLLVFL